MPDRHANFAVSTVATAPSPATSGTSLVVAAGEGTRFPDPATVGAYNCSIWPAGALPTPVNAEIVRVTAKSTDTLTITRTQESTSARTVVVGDQIAVSITKKTLNDAERRYFAHRIFNSPTAAIVVFNVNNTGYVILGNMFDFHHDFDEFPATDFRLVMAGNSNAAGQTVTLQVVPVGAATNPISAAGNDLVVSDGANYYESGWVAISDVLAGFDSLTIAAKGSNSTVDLSVWEMEIHFRYVPS